MWTFLKGLRKRQEKVELKVHPVEIASTPDIRGERNENRKRRLVLAIEVETDPEVKAMLQHELDRRKQFGR